MDRRRFQDSRNDRKQDRFGREDRYEFRDREFDVNDSYESPDQEFHPRTRGGIYGEDDARMEFGARERNRGPNAGRNEGDLRSSQMGSGTGFERHGYDRSFEESRRYAGPESYRRQSQRDHSHKDEGFLESVMNFFGMGPKGYRRSDERVHEDACEALARHPGIDAREIEVTVKEGVVTLSGTVASRRIKRMAEECVEDVSGVSDVQNQLRVSMETASTSATLATDSAKAPLKGKDSLKSDHLQ